MDLNKGVLTLFAYCEKLIRKISLNSTRVRALEWPLLGIKKKILIFFREGSVGQIINREYIVFQGPNVSCSLACTLSNRLFSCLHFLAWYASRL